MDAAAIKLVIVKIIFTELRLSDHFCAHRRLCEFGFMHFLCIYFGNVNFEKTIVLWISKIKHRVECHNKNKVFYVKKPTHDENFVKTCQLSFWRLLENGTSFRSNEAEKHFPKS